MADLFTRVASSWKTTVAGVAVIAITIAYLMGRLTLEQYLTAIGTLTGLGLMFSKDANVTGGKGKGA